MWQVYVQADGQYRTKPENIGQFRVRNAEGQTVPLSTLVTMKATSGPEFTIRFNGYRAAQINGAVAPGYSTGQAMAALEQRRSLPTGWAAIIWACRSKEASKGVRPGVIFDSRS